MGQGMRVWVGLAGFGVYNAYLAKIQKHEKNPPQEIDSQNLRKQPNTQQTQRQFDENPQELTHNHKGRKP
jgi:hypothetical protein